MSSFLCFFFKTIIMVDISERIQLLIKKMGMSSQIFAEKLNEKNPYRIRNVLSKKQKIPEDLLIKLVKTFNVNANWLLTGQGEMFITSPPERTLPQPLVIQHPPESNNLANKIYQKCKILKKEQKLEILSLIQELILKNITEELRREIEELRKEKESE
jgi:transcriptional regulator with XRE-family HTH domain